MAIKLTFRFQDGICSEFSVPAVHSAEIQTDGTEHRAQFPSTRLYTPQSDSRSSGLSPSPLCSKFPQKNITLVFFRPTSFYDPPHSHSRVFATYDLIAYCERERIGGPMISRLCKIRSYGFRHKSGTRPGTTKLQPYHPQWFLVDGKFPGGR